jgi:hypothetical protein
MAKCDEGYLCDVCGRDVAELTESDLYLRYVLGMIDPEQLHTARERHQRCNPTLAQFIVDEAFAPLLAPDPFDKRLLDPQERAERETFVSRGYRRLREVQALGLPIIEYPLPEVLDRLRRGAGRWGEPT